MIRCLIVIAAASVDVLISTGRSSADDLSKAIGTYETNGSYSQSLKIDRARAPGTFSGAFSVRTKGCLGEATMTGRATGARQIVFTERDESFGVCRITATFLPDFRSAQVAEDNCHTHGVSCSYDGTLKRKGR